MYHLHLIKRRHLDERKTLTKVSTCRPLTNIPQNKSAHLGTRKPGKTYANSKTTGKRSRHGRNQRKAPCIYIPRHERSKMRHDRYYIKTSVFMIQYCRVHVHFQVRRDASRSMHTASRSFINASQSIHNRSRPCSKMRHDRYYIKTSVFMIQYCRVHVHFQVRRDASRSMHTASRSFINASRSIHNRSRPFSSQILLLSNWLTIRIRLSGVPSTFGETTPGAQRYCHW